VFKRLSKSWRHFKESNGAFCSIPIQMYPKGRKKWDVYSRNEFFIVIRFGETTLICPKTMKSFKEIQEITTSLL
jgi:hypothetical protein